MTYIPDTRTDKTYNEKYLKEDDSQFICGYDACTDTVRNFFNNIDSFGDSFEDMLDMDTTKLIKDIDFEKDIEDFSEEELAEMSTEEKTARVFYKAITEWLEIDRDELITGLIDNDKEFDKHKEEVDSGKYKNAIIRQREYQEKYEKGEVPTCYEYKRDENGKMIKIGHCPNGTEVIEDAKCV